MEVYDYLKKSKELKSPFIDKLIEEYEQKGEKFSSEAKFFEHFSFIALNLRNEKNERFLRNALVELYQADEKFRKDVDEGIERLTLSFNDPLGFENNRTKVKL